MKKLFSILALSLLTTFSAFSQAPNSITYANNIETAIAKKGKKANPIFLNISDSKSENSNKMNKLTFKLSKVISFMNANFTNVSIDATDPANQSIASKYAVTVFPTYIVLSPEGNEIGRFTGYADADDFISTTKLVMDPQNSGPVKRAAFDKDRSFKNYCAYAEVLHREKKNKELTDFVESFLYVYLPDEKYSEQSWKYLKIALMRTTSRIFTAVLTDKYTANLHIGKSVLDAVFIKSLRNLTLEYMSGRSKETPQMVDAYIRFLSLIDDSNTASHYMYIAYKIFGQKDMEYQGANEAAYDGIADYLNANKICALEESERNYMINFFKSIKGMPEKHLKNFDKGINDYFKTKI